MQNWAIKILSHVKYWPADSVILTDDKAREFIADLYKIGHILNESSLCFSHHIEHESDLEFMFTFNLLHNSNKRLFWFALARQDVFYTRIYGNRIGDLWF